jgi:hypothetical protein
MPEKYTMRGLNNVIYRGLKATKEAVSCSAPCANVKGPSIAITFLQVKC